MRFLSHYCLSADFPGVDLTEMPARAARNRQGSGARERISCRSWRRRTLGESLPMTPSPVAPPPAPDATIPFRQDHTLALTAVLRLSAGGVLLAVAATWTVVRQIDLAFILLPMLAYVALAALAASARRRPLGGRLAIIMPFVDVALAFFVHRQGITLFPQYAAAWSVSSLGVFTLIVAVGGLSLPGYLVVFVTSLSVAAQWIALRVPGVTAYSLVVASGALTLVAVMTSTVPRLITAGLRREEQAARARDSLAQVREQNRQLEFLQREKDSLLEIIVHDMRGPVGAAMLSVEYLGLELKKRPDLAPLLEATDDAIATLNSLSALISQILDTSKLESGRITLRLDRIDVHQVLENTVREATPRANGRSINLAMEAPEGLFAALDLRLFPRALSVLVTHLLRHTPEGGRMSLVATGNEREVRLSLHCTAPAIPAADRERMFDKFPVAEGAPRPTSSWALGLYFCRLVVSTHQGTIAVEDVDGWSTSFVIRLPGQPRRGP
jgi:two-component system heavy metal sensor histidine kinase CusS